MAVKIGALFIDFQANTAKLRGDLGKAERAVKSNSAKMNRALATVEKAGRRLGRSFGKLGKSVFSLKGGIATLVGGAGIGLLIKRSLEAGDTIAKVADSIGISTDALQEYRFAADLAGVSQQSLDGAFAAFTKRLGEARAGTGTLVELLKKMDATLLKNIVSAGSTEEAIQLYFRALGKAGSAADKAALSAAAFGRQAGVAMVNLVKRGAAEIDRMREQAQRLGIVMDEDLLRKAEGAKDALTILGKVISTKVTVAILELAPTITELADVLTRVIPKLARFSAEALKLFGVIDRSPKEKLNNRIASLKATIALAEDMEKTKRGGFLDNLLGAGDARRSRLKAAREELAAIQTQLSDIARLTANAGRNTITPRPGKRTVGVGGPSKDALKAATKAIADQRKELDKLRAAANSIFEGTRTPIEQYRITIEGLNDLVSVGALDWDTYGRAVRNAQDRLDASKESLNAVRDGFKEVGVAALDSLGGIITGTTTARQALAGLLNTLSRVFSRVAGTALEKLIDGAFKSSPDGTNITLSPASTGFAPTGFNANDPLTRFAHGGSGIVGGVGGTDSQVVPIRATPGELLNVQTPAQQRAGGGGTIVNIDLRYSNGTDEIDRKVRQGIAAAAPFIVDSAVETVRDGASRTKKYFPGR